MPDAVDDVTALGRLIREVQRVNGWSYAEISRNASAAGRRLSKSRVESLRNDPLPSISVKAIHALAAGLRVPPERVAGAALETMGFGAAPGEVDAAAAVAADPALSDAMRRVLLAALATAREESRARPARSPLARRGTRPTAGNRLQRAAADDASTAS